MCCCDAAILISLSTRCTLIGGTLGDTWRACGTYTTPPSTARAARRARAAASRPASTADPEGLHPSSTTQRLRDNPVVAHVRRNNTIAAEFLLSSSWKIRGEKARSLKAQQRLRGYSRSQLFCLKHCGICS